MKIHILDIQEKPVIGGNVSTNCRKRLKFYPMHAKLNDERICTNCLKVHVSLSGVPSKYTFVLRN